MYSKKIQKLIDLFAKFPGIGPKTAARFVFFLTQNSEQGNQELALGIANLKRSIKQCQFCGKWHENKNSLCDICQNNSRNKELLCIVANETDLVSIENTNLYKGLYSIFNATSKSNNKELKIQELKNKIKNPEKFGLSNANFQEIILGLNPTVEGETITLYLGRELKDLNKKITRLGRGLPIGGELEYADKETLFSAFQNRK